MLPAPAADRFPRYPASWYLFGPAHEIGAAPTSREMLGKRLVAYRTSSGKVAILDGICSHLGADLGKGCVVADRLQCAFHHWQYGPDGRCLHIPAQNEIPERARQAAYPVVERHGLIYVFNGTEPLFPLPFFENCDPADFRPARPFGTTLDCPWFLIGANAFDLQHFRAAHDRRLVETPAVACPSPFARRAIGTFSVCGDSWQDRITRLFAGPRVTMSITDWCGNMMFTTATFRRTTSYGMVITEPLESGVIVRVVVFVPQSRTWLGRALKDPLHRWIRRFMIMRFLSADAGRLNGVRYSPHGLIEADGDLIEYLRWLADVSHGRPAPVEPTRPACWRVESFDSNHQTLVPSLAEETP